MAKEAKTLKETLRNAQGRFLRAITGAYKATATEALEIETLIEPLDIYIEKTATTGIVRQVLDGYNKKIRLLGQNLALRTRGKRGRKRKAPPFYHEKTLKWLKTHQNIDIHDLLEKFKGKNEF